MIVASIGGAWVILAASAGVTAGNLGAAWLAWRHERQTQLLLGRCEELQLSRQRLETRDAPRRGGSD